MWGSIDKHDADGASSASRAATHVLVGIAVLGAFPLLELSHRNLGSGDHRHGIGSGCNLEREEDALLVTGTYLLTLFAALVTRSAFRSRVSAPTFLGLTVIAIAVALGPTTVRYRAERPYWVLQGPTAESFGDGQCRAGLRQELASGGRSWCSVRMLGSAPGVRGTSSS
ncbi:MAG: hypothetical protein GY724_25845 [Actinomycetia bacterium]|nr:hypothetical protein [Actinomycetes bacterium]